MLRLSVGVVSSLIWFAGVLPAQPQEAPRPEPGRAQIKVLIKGLDQPIRIWEAESGKALLPPIWKMAPGKDNTNQEVIDLLKKVIQKLEGQNQPQQFKMLFRFQKSPEGKETRESPEVEAARAAVKAAEANLAAARTRLAKILEAQQGQARESELKLKEVREHLERLLKAQKAAVEGQPRIRLEPVRNRRSRNWRNDWIG